jgi:hypothetical protein
VTQKELQADLKLKRLQAAIGGVERTDHNIKGDVRNFNRPVTTSMHKLGENKEIDVSTINATTIQ